MTAHDSTRWDLEHALSSEGCDEFIRKNDYRFMSEGFGSEGDAWIRAIECLSGA